MANAPHRHTIPGSERAPVAGARATGNVMADERVEVSVLVRPGPGQRDLADNEALVDKPPAQRHYLSRDEFARHHGAAAADIAKVAEFAKAHGLAVVEASAARRTVVLSGPAAALSEAFGTTLQQFEHDGGTYRGRTGSLSVPANLEGVVEGVFGLDNRPQATPHFQVLGVDESASSRARREPRSRRRNWPRSTTSRPVPTAVASASPSSSSGGGFKPADISAYFTGLKLPVPDVRAISVDGGRNHPTNANSADGEVMLDIEVAAAIAPKATIAVYFAPEHEPGLPRRDHHRRSRQRQQAVGHLDQLGIGRIELDRSGDDAVRQGFPGCRQPGRHGLLRSRRQRLGRRRHGRQAACRLSGVEPVRARLRRHQADRVGHGHRQRSGLERERQDQRDRRRRERLLALPAYQKNAKVPVVAGGSKAGRGVPDVAGDADPNSGYRVRVDGQTLVIGGTSAVAPLWAGLVALMNQKLGKPVGYLNPLLYGSVVGKGAFRDIVNGNNGSYSATAGWDPCTGWGSPVGSKLFKALS